MKKTLLSGGIVVLCFFLCSCGSLDDADLTGTNTTVTLQIHNPDSSAKGTAKAVDSSDAAAVAKAVGSSSVTECTLTAKRGGVTTDTKTVSVPSGTRTVETTFNVSANSGYQFCAECLDTSKTSNSVSPGFRGCTNNVTISGSDTVSVSGQFLNLASNGGIYVRFRQDNSTQFEIDVGWGETLSDSEKSTAVCYVEIDTSLAGTSPTTVDASTASGLVSGTKGRPYFQIGPGITRPACKKINTAGVGELKTANNSYTTDADGNTVSQCKFGVRQSEGIATGRNAFWAAVCAKDGSTWSAIPSASRMAEYNTSGGGDGDVASLAAVDASCTVALGGRDCSSGFCRLDFELNPNAAMTSGVCIQAGARTLNADVTTEAGSTEGDQAGSATSAQFNDTRGLCVDATGSYIFIMDSLNNKIKFINLQRASTDSLRVTTYAGDGNAGSDDGACNTASFNRPNQCIVDTFQNTPVILYVSELGNDTIRRIIADSDGNCSDVSTWAGSGTAGFTNGTGTGASFNDPGGLVILSDDTIFVTEGANHTIRKISSSQVVTTFVGDGTAGSTNGTGTSARLNSPTGLTTNRDTSETFLYVADAGNGSIRKVNIATAEVTNLVSNGTFSDPQGLVLELTGTTLYIIDGNIIKKVNASSGSVSTLAGSSSAGSTNGNGTSASFNGPTAIAVNNRGVIWIGDAGNDRIRRIE